MKDLALAFTRLFLAGTLASSLFAADNTDAFELTLRHRLAPHRGGDGTVTERRERWHPEQTAVIVCDMWDAHHCLNATKRGAEMAPRMNAFLKEARRRGAAIIHAPSSCMAFYEDHPARKRAQRVTRAENLPEGIDDWLHWIDEKEAEAGYPIDHSDGGEDDDPEAHEKWAKELEERGRNPEAPWIRQTELLEIDPERDYITDNGTENWSILEKEGIEQVLVVGVHTNMCVLGRPFGLRQLAKNGKNVALVRDLTDTMYNPAREPYVSHFRGTDLVVEHVETFVCPTITSDQVLGGAPFHFEGDSRKHLVMLIGEKEYKTAETLPAFAREHLADTFRLTVVHASPDDPNDFSGIAALEDADLLWISVRRRALPQSQMETLRHYIAAGKPVIGIRTASHAFSLREKPAPEGHAVWEDFDPQVFGGNYHGHHGGDTPSFAWMEKEGRDHPVLEGFSSDEFPTGGSLYQVSPLEEGTQILLMGRAGDKEPHEPVAWTRETAEGGRVFYTSLGHPEDFKNAQFQRMLENAAAWAVGAAAE